jgi:FkbM family methyltransferase
MRRLRDHLTLTSLARYLAWRALKSARPLVVELRDGERIALRPPPAADLDTAYEVFVLRIYDPVRSAVSRPLRIVDVGANVGYTCVLWGHAFPEARVTAFEPHPRHVRALRQNLALNGLDGNVEVVEAAAGVSAGRAAFLDAENESGLVASGRPASSERVAKAGAPRELEVKVVDFFELVGEGPLDLLKMDIEGGEYPLLSDPRFAALRARAIALEWHVTPTHPDGKRWCEQRLRELGYAVQEGKGGTRTNGMLFGTRA